MIKEGEIFLILTEDGGLLFEGTFDHFRDVFFSNVTYASVIQFVKDSKYTIYKRIELD